MTLGESIQKWRSHRNLSVYALAKAAGVYPNKIFRIENGTHNDMYIMDVIKIAKALVVSLDDLVDGVEPKAHEPRRRLRKTSMKGA